MNTNYHKKFDKRDRPQRAPTTDDFTNQGVPVPETNIDFIQGVPLKDEVPKKQIRVPILVVGNCENLNLREKPSLDAPIKTVLKRGTRFDAITQEDEEWFYVRVKNQEGFVMKKYVKEE